MATFRMAFLRLLGPGEGLLIDEGFVDAFAGFPKVGDVSAVEGVREDVPDRLVLEAVDSPDGAGLQAEGVPLARDLGRGFAEEVKERNYNLDFNNPHTVDEDHGDPEELLAQLEESERETAQVRERLKAMLAEALLR